MADNLPPSIADVMESESLDLPEPFGSHRPYGITLHFTLLLPKVFKLIAESYSELQLQTDCTILVRRRSSEPILSLCTPEDDSETSRNLCVR
jgi:hypothetical protein